MKNEPAPQVKSAAVWEQVGGPSEENGPDAGDDAAQATPEDNGDAVPEGADVGNPADDTEIVR